MYGMELDGGNKSGASDISYDFTQALRLFIRFQIGTSVDNELGLLSVGFVLE